MNDWILWPTLGEGGKENVWWAEEKGEWGLQTGL